MRNLGPYPFTQVALIRVSLDQGQIDTCVDDESERSDSERDWVSD